MKPNTTPYRGLIEEWCRLFGFDPDLIEALIIVESGGNADAFRYEPGFYRRYLKGKEGVKSIYFDLCHDGPPLPRRIASSYGLMQVMYPTAVDAGYRDLPEYLFIPLINLHWGLTVLDEIRREVEEEIPDEGLRQKVMLARWNGGKKGNPRKDGSLRNIDYAIMVEKCCQRLKEWRKREAPA
ncbi:hypothetical protein CEE39_08570 [bacterium (candidate division B38) B3_B38]|nr:MAG: hypothetical protein CEE39_08570 [bacterium (candidate division B38) B3_B38]